MLKYSFLKSTTILNMVLILILILFSSCAVTRYDYYYASIAPFSNGLSEKQDRIKDSISFSMYFFDGKNIKLYSRNFRPAYVNFGESEVKINNILYRIEPTEDIKNKNDTALLIKRIISFSGSDCKFIISGFTNQDIISLYNKYDKNEYVSYIPDTSEVDIEDKPGWYSFTPSEYKKLRHSKMLCKEFTEDDTPLKISLKVVYYTDSLFQDRNIAYCYIYQTRLLKMQNMRYDETDDSDAFYRRNEIYRWGEQISGGMRHLAFHTKSKSGKIWGWPEARYGLGWTLTVITLPITFPINLIGFINSGYERVPIPVPLFQ